MKFISKDFLGFELSTFGPDPFHCCSLIKLCRLNQTAASGLALVSILFQSLRVPGWFLGGSQKGPSGSPKIPKGSSKLLRRSPNVLEGFPKVPKVPEASLEVPNVPEGSKFTFAEEGGLNRVMPIFRISSTPC